MSSNTRYVCLPIGLMAAAALTSCSIVRGDSEAKKYSVAIAELRALGEGVEVIRLKSSSYPQSVDELKNAFSKSDIPGKDPWGNDYRFGLTDDSDFYIESSGADGEIGTDDDVFYSSARGVINLRERSARDEEPIEIHPDPDTTDKAYR